MNPEASHDCGHMQYMHLQVQHRSRHAACLGLIRLCNIAIAMHACTYMAVICMICRSADLADFCTATNSCCASRPICQLGSVMDTT